MDTIRKVTVLGLKKELLLIGLCRSEQMKKKTVQQLKQKIISKLTELEGNKKHWLSVHGRTLDGETKLLSEYGTKSVLQMVIKILGGRGGWPMIKEYDGMGRTRWSMDDGNHKFVCGVYGCDAERKFEDVCEMVPLSPEDRESSENTLFFNTKDCIDVKSRPGCKSAAERTAFSDLSVTGCPSVRDCPSCGLLVQHDTTGCKSITCTQCKVEFCFACLKLTKVCKRTRGYYKPCSDGAVPRQTYLCGSKIKSQNQTKHQHPEHRI